MSETINDRFKILRKTCHKSQESWGKIIGITKSGVSDIESSRRSVTEQHIIMLRNCKDFNVNEDWLRNGGPLENMFVSLSHSEEVAMYTQDLLMSDDVVATSIKNIIVMYEKLDDTSKKVWQNTFKEFLNMMQKEQV